MSDDALAEYLAKRDLGTVIVWDTGPYQNITERDGKLVPVAEALADGHVKVWLLGHRIEGGTP